jgi:8-amino-7-oxononanoate synthase
MALSCVSIWREARRGPAPVYFAAGFTKGETILQTGARRPNGRGFERLPGYVRLKKQQAELARLGIANPYFQAHEGVSGATMHIGRRELLNFAGYNYLGLCGHPEVATAAKAAIDRYGTSVSASRIASGEIPLHRELEQAVARLLGTEDCLAFVSGYGTNVTTIGHLFGPRDLILQDARIHNSARLGATLSGARRMSFPHNDPAALERMLRERRGQYRRALIVVEGVYSMDGDIPDLPRLIEIKKRHQALLMVDEAHSIGVLGSRGHGIGEHFDIEPGEVDIWMGTLSKTLAGCGGYIAGCAALIENLKYTAPGFVYSVGLSPADAGAALAALGVMQREPQRVTRLRALSALFLRLAGEAGLDTGSSGASAIVPVIVGDSMRALRLAQQLFESGINVQPILYPAVPESSARLRFFVTALHREEHLRAAVQAVGAALAGLHPVAAPRTQRMARALR